MKRYAKAVLPLFAVLFLFLWGCENSGGSTSSAVSSLSPSPSAILESTADGHQEEYEWRLLRENTFFINPGLYCSEPLFQKGTMSHFCAKVEKGKFICPDGTVYTPDDLAYFDGDWYVFSDGTRFFDTHIYGEGVYVGGPPTPEPTPVIHNRVAEYDEKKMVLENGITIERPFDYYYYEYTPTDDLREIVEIITTEERYGHLVEYLSPEALATLKK